MMNIITKIHNKLRQQLSGNTSLPDQIVHLIATILMIITALAGLTLLGIILNLVTFLFKIIIIVVLIVIGYVAWQNFSK
jgi:hypothetical protein